MKRLFVGRLLFVLGIAGFLAPVPALADTLSVSQVIVVTARVAPARSIVVNDKGQMIRIYSNTNENVSPKVYLNDVPGVQQSLTPALQTQYAAIIAQHKDLNGKAIQVPLPAQPVLSTRLQAVLTNTFSIISR